MNTKQVLFALVAVLPSAAAVAGEQCGPDSACAAEQYIVYQPSATCPPHANMQLPAPASSSCKPDNVAPDAAIDCTRIFGGFSCKGWNRGTTAEPFGFHWSVSPQMQLLTSPDYPDAIIKCGSGPVGGGMVTLTVTSPVFLQSATSVSLSCGNDLRLEQ